MVRADRIATAAGGLLAKAALGFIGLAMIVGWYAPPPERAAAAASPPGDPDGAAMTVTLHVPEGAMAKHLTVVDGSGRELAILTHWISGMTTVAALRSHGAGVSYNLNTDGSARMLVQGTERVTLVDAERDGTTRVRHRVLPGVDRRARVDGETPTGPDD